MKIDKKSASKTKKQWNSIDQKKTQRGTWNSNIISSSADVSVFTRSTNPKVIIESEEINNNYRKKTNRNRDKILKFLCSIIMCLIILMTFFLSLKTYNTVQDLSKYFIS